MNAPGAKFCHQCGTSLTPVACLQCGTSVQPGTKFCGQCGKAVA
ncbi:MAG: zinc ribbon domain-containing protein [Pseudomonadota bacterium]